MATKPKVQLNIDLAPELHAQVVRIAERTDRPVIHVIREALSEYVERVLPCPAAERRAE